MGCAIPWLPAAAPAEDPRQHWEEVKRSHRQLIEGWRSYEDVLKVRGSVTDEQDRPLAGVLVGLGPYGLLPLQFNGETDEQGRFDLPWPDKAILDSIVANGDGYAATRIPYAPSPGNGVIKIQLKKGRTVRGRIVDREQRGIADALVVCVARVPNSTSWTVQIRMNTDADGRFKWTGACAENVVVYAAKSYRYVFELTTLKADGIERVVELGARSGLERYETPVEKIYAYYVEPYSVDREPFPLFMTEVDDNVLLSARKCPQPSDYGYFECRPFELLNELSAREETLRMRELAQVPPNLFGH